MAASPAEEDSKDEASTEDKETADS